MQPEILDSQDAGEIEAFVRRVYSHVRLGNAGGRTHARISRRALSEAVVFDDAEWGSDIGYAAPPPGQLIICDVVRNTIRTENRGVEHTLGPGDLFLIARPELPYAGVALRSASRSTVLDPAVLNRVTGIEDPTAGPVRLLDHRPVSPAAQLRLQRTITYLRDDVLTANGAPVTPLVAETASQLLAASVLHTYPHTALTEATPADRRDASPSTLRRAVAFIEANPDQPIAVADIAAAAFVTVRTIQLAFRRHLDTTPMAYLRRVRLDRAHADLQTADPEHTTVTDVAMRWGFADLSRFAAGYRAAYDCHPHVTLRRAGG